MKQFAKHLSLLLVALVLLTGFAMGQTTTSYDFSDPGAVTGLDEASPGISLDANIGFGSFKNSGSSNPAIYSGQLRLYQNATKGGSIKIYASNGVTITQVVINASDRTGPAAYTVDGGAASDITASSGTYTMSSLSGTSVVEFYQKDADSGNRIYVDNFDVTYTAGSIDPEPTNHVTSFSASSDHESVDLSWNDNDGAQAASGFLIKASTTSLVAISAPSDETAESNDTDLSDGSGAINVLSGVEEYSWAGLDDETTYYFKIWPYTNSGSDIDYKTDGTVPSATQATTATPDEPTAGDLIISEVVGDDADATNDDGFMEIYNNTSKTLNLSNVQARYFNSNPGDVTQTVSLSGAIAPGAYVVVTQNNTNFESEYGSPADYAGSNFYFNGGDDGVDIYHTSNGIIDQFNDNGVGASPWTWDDANVFERSSTGSGAVSTNWTEVTSGNGTPGSSNDTPLPITLTSFTAEAKNGVVELAWETASEVNNAAFVIYRNDVAIASVEGAGTTSEPSNYSYVDAEVVPGVAYTYVLADVDYANVETKYEAEAVTVTLVSDVLEADFVVGAAYPNPFNPTAVVPLTLSADAMVEASVYDLLGREVKALVNGNFAAGTHELHIDGSNMTTGIYLVKVMVDNVANIQKIALMK